MKSSTVRTAAAAWGRKPFPTRRRSASITAFIAWTAWTASARRPGPALLVHQQLAARTVGRQPVDRRSRRVEYAVDHHPAGRDRTDAGRIRPLLPACWVGTGRKNAACASCRRAEVLLTPAQRSTAWYFFAVAALFLVQTLLGGATAHYHAETGGFFGLDLAQVATLQPDPHLAPPIGHLLRGHRLPGGRHFPGSPDRRPRAARPTVACPSCCWAHWSWSWSAAWPARRPAIKAGYRTMPSH